MGAGTLAPPKDEKDEREDTGAEDNPSTPEPGGPNPPQDDPPGDDGDKTAALQEPGEELHMEGDEGYLSTDAGGKSPTDSKLQITGKSVSIEGQVKKGKRIRAVVELEVGDVKFSDKKDSQTGQIVACTRTHYAKIVGFAKE